MNLQELKSNPTDHKVTSACYRIFNNPSDIPEKMLIYIIKYITKNSFDEFKFKKIIKNATEPNYFLLLLIYYLHYMEKQKYIQSLGRFEYQTFFLNCCIVALKFSEEHISLKKYRKIVDISYYIEFERQLIKLIRYRIEPGKKKLEKLYYYYIHKMNKYTVT